MKCLLGSQKQWLFHKVKRHCLPTTKQHTMCGKKTNAFRATMDYNISAPMGHGNGLSG